MLQRPERIVLLALGSFFGEGGLRFVVWILAIFANHTAIQRMRLVAKSMAAKEPDTGGGEASSEASDPKAARS